jgi:MoxR-like ATPase
MNPQQFSELFEQTVNEISRVVLHQEDMVEHVLTALLARGHVLIEGVPGLGKTLLARALSHVCGAEQKRIQFTPDLMPSDVTGGNVFNQRDQQFVFMPGPVFTQLLLADEINRAPAKTQSALLEAMQDHCVTTDGTTRQLPEPFLVIATQNPVESQGTYPLPEAQLDRFLLKVLVGYPTKDAEEAILENYLGGFNPSHLGDVGLRPVLSTQQMLQMQAFTDSVRVEREIVSYITDIVCRTRVHPSVELGASPRASVALLQTARVQAAIAGRDFVIPDDVKSMAPSVLRHRLILHPDAELEGITADHCVQTILRDVVVPHSAVNAPLEGHVANAVGASGASGASGAPSAPPAAQPPPSPGGELHPPR